MRVRAKHPAKLGEAMRIALKSGLLIAGIATLGGCINLGGTTRAPDRLIRFTPEASLPAGPGQIAGGTPILVTEPVTDRTLAVSRVAVQVDDTRLAYLPDVAFVERPARLFRGLLAEALRVKGAGNTTGAAVVLEDDQPAPIGARRLSGRLLTLGYDARTHAVVVRFDALWQGADGALAQRRFEAVEQGVSANASAVAPALNRVANDVAGQVATWVATQGG